jgi:hypothetical protein
MPKLSLIQRLTNEMFKLNKKAKRDPRTKDEYLVRFKLHRIENIIRKRYGEIYYLTTKNVGDTVVDEKGEEYDMFQLQREWISKNKLGRRTKH